MSFIPDTSHVADTLSFVPTGFAEQDFLITVGVVIIVTAVLAIAGFAFLVSWISRGCP